VKPSPAVSLGLKAEDIRKFSFLRALNALAHPNDTAAQSDAAFEREVSAATLSAMKTAGHGGIMIAPEILNASARDLTVSSSTGGGHTVATNLLSSSFIELLRKRMVLQRLGATVLDNLVGNVAIPRQTSSATGYWVAENTAVTESQQAVDQVTMAPKTYGTYTDISRKLVVQTGGACEQFVRNDLTKVIGLGIDNAGLYGSGSSNQPNGLKNQTGVNTVDFAAAAPTYAEIVQLESEIASDNADVENMKYLVNATGRGTLKTTEKASSTGQFLWEPGNTVNGYPCETSNQVASGDYWFGNWADLIIGMWGGLELLVDPYTGSTAGTVRVVALQDVDVACRHGESFCRGNNTL
jgi:HK97 family phage major capsid protein